MKINAQKTNLNLHRVKAALLPYEYEGAGIIQGGGDTDCHIIDLLTDLRHLCDEFNYDFASLDGLAYTHYIEEKYPSSVARQSVIAHLEIALAIFRDSARDVDDIGDEIGDESYVGVNGRVYLDGTLHIEPLVDDQWAVLLERDQETGTLAQCEKMLFAYAMNSGYLNVGSQS